MQITLDQLRWHRLMRSGLVIPFASAEDCSEALIGAQAQMPRAAALAIASRVPRFSLLEFENLLYRRRSLVRTWGQRHTLHAYRASDWPNLVAVLCARRSWAYNNFRKAGGSDAKYEALLDKIDVTLRGGKVLTRTDLATQVGIDSSAWGGLLIDAAYRGLVCDAGDRRLSHGERWASNLQVKQDRERIRADLVQRYLHSYGPARPADIAFWFGEKVGVVKKWLTKLDLIEVVSEGIPLLAVREDYDTLASLTPPRYAKNWPIIMLYRFDPLLLAHKTKEWIVPAEHYDKVWTAGGHVAGVILQRGVATATWWYTKRANRYPIKVKPFSKTNITKRIQKKVAQHEKFIRKFFGN